MTVGKGPDKGESYGPNEDHDAGDWETSNISFCKLNATGNNKAGKRICCSGISKGQAHGPLPASLRGFALGVLGLKSIG